MADYANQQQKIKEATEQLEAGIKEFFSSDKFQEYLNVMSRFHSYSYSNSVMIAMQKPDATLLAGFSGWQKNFDRHVKAGERGIRIFAPAPVKTKVEREKKDPDTKLPVLDENGEPVMETVEIKTPRFKIVTVFDVSQTDGKPLPSLGVDELTGNVEQFSQFFEALKRTSTVPIGFKELHDGSNGYYSPAEKRIAIREGMSEVQTVKTAIHELAHSRLHDFDRTKPPAEAEKRKDRNTREVEAESVAYVVCQHFGIDTSDYSFGYVATWSASRELPELKASLQTIRDAASSLIDEIQENLASLQKEQTLVQDTLEETAVKPAWRCYIVPDLLTWARPDPGKERTEIEYFDTFEEAAARFRGLRTERYNAETSVTDDAGLPCARLAFGIQRENPPSAVDLLHVRAGKNVLSDDFFRMEAVKSDPDALEILARIGSKIGFDEVLVNRTMTAEEIKAFTFDHFKYKLEQSGVPQIDSYLAGFDQLYGEGQLDSMKPSANQQQIKEMVAFPVWENPYFQTEDTPERLASDLSVFMMDYDPNSAVGYQDIFAGIQNHQADYLTEWLSSVAGENSSFSAEAQALIKRFSHFAPQRSQQEDRMNDAAPPQPVQKEVPKVDLHCPVYYKDLKQARTDGELEQWRSSHKATQACAEQFQKEYERAYGERQVPQFLQQMVDRYGIERCKIVIASTIQLSPYDGRYSQDMKEIAAKVVIPGKNTEPLHDRRLDYHINCHPVTVNVAMRDLLVIERQQEKPAQRPKRKESVLGKLKRNQAAIAAGTSAAKENAKGTPQLS